MVLKVTRFSDLATFSLVVFAFAPCTLLVSHAALATTVSVYIMPATYTAQGQPSGSGHIIDHLNIQLLYTYMYLTM